MSKYGTYRSYQGRRKRRRFLRALSLALLVCFLAFGVWFAANHIVYTEDGIMLDLPFLAWMVTSPEPTASPSPAETFHIIIESTPSPTPAPTPSPTPAPTPEPLMMRAILVPQKSFGDPLTLQHIAETAAALGADTLVFEYKDETGSIASPETLAAVLELFADLPVTRSALISAGVDNTIPLGVNTAWALKHDASGLNFWDANRNRWLNLFLPEVRDYIVSLCEEALDAGFDRVLLNHVAFPYVGSIETVRYNQEQRDMGFIQAVNALLYDLQEHFGSSAESPLDAIICEETAIQGSFAAAGQDLGEFSLTFQNLFVNLPEDAGNPGEGLLSCIAASDAELMRKLSSGGWFLYDWEGAYPLEEASPA